MGISHQGVSISTEEFRNYRFDLVITVCDDAAENCLVWLGSGKKVHIGFPDPAKAMGSNEGALAEFRRVRDDIRKKIIAYLQKFQSETDPILNNRR